MGLLSADDLDAAIAALGGVDVTIGSETVKGILRTPDVALFEPDEANLVGRSVTVLIRAGALSGLAIGATVTVAGEVRKVHRYMDESDGSVTRILGTKA